MNPVPLPTPTLNTPRLLLRPLEDKDEDDLYAMHSNRCVLRFWDAPPWTERERASRFIAASREMAEEGSGARAAVQHLSDGTFLGWCGLTRWNPVHRSASLGYVLRDTAWGHGYATEAARALLAWGFKTLDMNRVQAETLPGHDPVRDSRRDLSLRRLSSSAAHRATRPPNGRLPPQPRVATAVCPGPPHRGPAGRRGRRGSPSPRCSRTCPER